MTSRIFVAAALCGFAVLWVLQHGAGRRLLWPIVEVCKLDQRLIGAAAPCLAVVANGHGTTGYAILRSPVDRSHVVLTPLVRIAGIEAPQLRQFGFRHLVADAWSNRRYAYPSDAPPPRTNAVGLAINSQRGRTQDQLHIHIDCALSYVTRHVTDAVAGLAPGRWARLDINPGEEPYAATPLGDSLEGRDLVELSALHLKLTEKEMPLLTLAVFSTRDDPLRPGFVLLTRKDLSRQHAELLLDHDCAEYRRLTIRGRRPIATGGVRFASTRRSLEGRSQ